MISIKRGMNEIGRRITRKTILISVQNRQTVNVSGLKPFLWRTTKKVRKAERFESSIRFV